MSKSKYLFLLFICLSASISIRAQFMDYGSDPARFKWNMLTPIYRKPSVSR